MTKLTTCKYWVASRQRFCKFQIAKDSTEYCSVHNTGSGDNERIPCPVDPKHMIYKRDLEKHIGKCSKVIEDIYSSKQPFTRKGCNLAEAHKSDSLVADQSIIDEIEMISWFNKLSKARSDLLQKIRAKFPEFFVPDESQPFTCHWSEAVEDCVRAMTGHSWDSRKDIDKHNLQNACLLEVLKNTNLAPSSEKSRLFVELGCGKAGLTRWLIYSMEGGEKSCIFLLMDYEARRNKQENRKDLQSKISSSSIVRLRSNITDVDLSLFLEKKTEVPPIIGKPGSVEFRLSELEAKVATIQSRHDWPFNEIVGIAKHLCGAATDFGLRCLLTAGCDKDISLSFATCCHHRCDLDQLVGHEELANLCPTQSEFKRMISMAGWATTEGIAENKRTVGRLVKGVIDLCRVNWIVSNFKNIQTLEYRKYIEDGITPENFCIVVKSRRP